MASVISTEIAVGNANQSPPHSAPSCPPMETVPLQFPDSRIKMNTASPSLPTLMPNRKSRPPKGEEKFELHDNFSSKLWLDRRLAGPHSAPSCPPMETVPLQFPDSCIKMNTAWPSLPTLKPNRKSRPPKGEEKFDLHDKCSSQLWLDRRLAGLTMTHLYPQPANIYCISSLSPPPGFEQAWVHCTEKLVSQLTEGRAGQIAEELMNLEAIIILCNPLNQKETELLIKLVSAVDMLGQNAPPMFWVPHTVCPQSRATSVNMPTDEHSILRKVMDIGIDGIVHGEPESFDLVLSISSLVQTTAARTRVLMGMLNQVQEKAEMAGFLEECIHVMLWDYVRPRLAPAIPPVDYDIPPGQPEEIEQYTVGKVLGRGAFGSVCKLNPKGSSSSFGLPAVVKFISKEGLTKISDLRGIKHAVEVHVLLSSPEHRHVNVVQLFTVFHSITHFMFVMEDGGPENLYRLLSYRHHPVVARRRPMACSTVNSLISQAVTVIRHIHMSVGVCHRDLKPENFVVLKHNGLILKLTDFDLSLIWKEDMQCQSPCGTQPFTAPEVMLEPAYDGRKCDIWSLGVVILEMLCGSCILEKALGLDFSGGQGRSSDNNQVPRQIRKAFTEPEAAKKILMQRHLPEVEQLVTPMTVILNGMLNVDVKERWHADQVVQCYQQFAQ